MSPKCAKNSKKKLICGTCFWHNFRTISAFVWEGLLTPDTLLDAKRVGGIPILGSETQGQANRRAQKSFFEEDNDFWRFFLNFLCFFVPPFYLLFFWLRVFLFIRQKNTKKLFNETKNKKYSTHFLFEKHCRARAPATQAKNNEDRPIWGQQNDVENVRKSRQKWVQKATKNDGKNHQKILKNNKKTQTTWKKSDNGKLSHFK